jgi:hypothetical protein
MINTLITIYVPLQCLDSSYSKHADKCIKCVHSTGGVINISRYRKYRQHCSLKNGQYLLVSKTANNKITPLTQPIHTSAKTIISKKLCNPKFVVKSQILYNNSKILLSENSTPWRALNVMMISYRTYL